MRTIMLVVLTVTLAACSKLNDGAGGGGPNGNGGSGAGSQADCHAFCEVLASAPCPAGVTVADCEQGCQEMVATCPTDGAQVVSCTIASGLVQCDDTGAPAPFGCDDALYNLSVCEESSGSSGPGSTSGVTTGGNTSSTSTGSPTDCIPPNVGGCGHGVSCCVYPGSGSNPASVPVCHLDTGFCCIPSGDGCSDDFQCCVGLACVLSDPNDSTSGKFCK